MRESLVARVSAAVLVLAVSAAAATAAPKKTAKGGASKAKPSAAQIAAGKKLFPTSGCTGCHKMDGKGGTSGPDLSHEGKAHDAVWITQKLKNPKATNKDSIMPPFKGSTQDQASLAAYLASLK